MKQGHRETTVSRGRSFVPPCTPESGFTLLEVLVAVALLAIAVTVVIQLFSANLRSVTVSEDYVSAALKANVVMREVLDDEDLTEKSRSERTNDGYRVDVAVTETAKERTDNLQVRLLEVTVKVSWAKGIKERSLALKTLKVVNKKV